MIERRRRGYGLGRWVAIGLGVAAALLLAAAPAAAEDGGPRSASAFWDVGDAQRSLVSLQGNTGSDPGGAGWLFLVVNQSFCDSATDEMVFRDFSSQGSISPASFRVHPLLKSATLSLSTTVTGTEFRLPGCGGATGPPTFSDLGVSTIEIDASWTSTNATYEVQPGIAARDAVATGSITGSILSPGPLGPSLFARLQGTA